MKFQSTPPARGATLTTSAQMQACTFQSTPPARGATARGGYTNIWMHISIHAPREGGDAGFPVRTGPASNISIHAPREGGDARGGYTNIWMHISIHAPREGGDIVDRGAVLVWIPFQSTPPARGATI